MFDKDIVVLKFGGAALATVSLIENVANIIIKRSEQYSNLVVVVSAMGKMTDELLGLAYQIHPEPPQREVDMLVTVGERISISLLAMALAKKTRDAVSFTGSQSGIITTNHHREAKIIDVKPKRIQENLLKGRIVIVAGFQGVSLGGEITTLGRGGSDTSAVALGVSLKASRVEFYKNVEGIYTADPQINKSSKLLRKLTYKKALEVITPPFVLHPRSVRLASQNSLPLAIYSFLNFKPNSKEGTLVYNPLSLSPEKNIFEY